MYNNFIIIPTTNESVLHERDSAEPTSCSVFLSVETPQPKAISLLSWHNPGLLLGNILTWKRPGELRGASPEQRPRPYGIAFPGKDYFYAFWRVYSSGVMPHLHRPVLGNPVNNSLCLFLLGAEGPWSCLSYGCGCVPRWEGLIKLRLHWSPSSRAQIHQTEDEIHD